MSSVTYIVAIPSDTLLRQWKRTESVDATPPAGSKIMVGEYEFEITREFRDQLMVDATPPVGSKIMLGAYEFEITGSSTPADTGRWARRTARNVGRKRAPAGRMLMLFACCNFFAYVV